MYFKMYSQNLFIYIHIEQLLNSSHTVAKLQEKKLKIYFGLVLACQVFLSALWFIKRWYININIYMFYLLLLYVINKFLILKQCIKFKLNNQSPSAPSPLLGPCFIFPPPMFQANPLNPPLPPKIKKIQKFFYWAQFFFKISAKTPAVILICLVPLFFYNIVVVFSLSFWTRIWNKLDVKIFIEIIGQLLKILGTNFGHQKVAIRSK